MTVLKRATNLGVGQIQGVLQLLDIRVLFFVSREGINSIMFIQSLKSLRTSVHQHLYICTVTKSQHLQITFWRVKVTQLLSQQG